jgi:nucleotide-binding universal stress UspA family protein
MTLIKTILVPTDFSIPADYAIRYAVNLASLFDASIILYHTFIPFESGFYPLAQSDKENLETEKKLTDRTAKIRDVILKSSKDIPISIYVDRGPITIKLAEFCKKNKIDLIVMGTQGASSIKEILIGSFTAKVMTKAPCPVLAIPNEYKFKMPKQITYATNYGKKDKKVIQYILELNNLFKAKLTILHIDDKKHISTAEEELEKYKKTIELQYKEIPFSYHHILGKDISKALLDQIMVDKTDILVLNPVKRKGIWQHVFHKSVTKKTVCHSLIPLLTIPAK